MDGRTSDLWSKMSKMSGARRRDLHPRCIWTPMEGLLA